MADKRMQYGDGRDALVAAVVEVVAEMGLSGMTFRKVAARAGVANTLITHYFGSRNALLNAALEWTAKETLDLIDMSAPDAFSDDFSIRFVAAIDSRPELQFFQYEMLLAARHQPEIRKTIEHHYENYIETLARGFKERGFVNSQVLARVFFAATDGLVMQQLSFDRKSIVAQGFELLGSLLESAPRRDPCDSTDQN